MSQKKISSFINVFLIISFINLSISQNIITSWHYDKVQMYDLQKIGTILSTQIKEKVKKLPDFTVDTLTISNLTLSDIQQSLYDSYLNFNTGLLLFTPNKVTLSFTFSYSTQGSSGSASFDLKINILKMRLTNNKQDQTQSVKINMVSTENDYSVFQISDKEISAKVKTALYTGFENNKYLDRISSEIDLISYYKDFYQKKNSMIFYSSSFLDSKQIIIAFNRFVGFCEDVTGKAESALCYYSGDFEEADKTDKTKVPLSNEDFVNPKDTYNTFINMDLINQIINKIMRGGITEKTFNQNSMSKTLPYDFTVGSLKNYFTGLDKYGNSENFEVKVNINELNLKSTKFNAAFNIGNDKNVFSLDIEFDNNLKIAITKSVRINLCLESIKNLKFSIKSGDVVIGDESKLKADIEETFNNAPLGLTDNGITLRDYYSIITKGYIKDEGVYLEGNQLYQ